MSRTLLGVLAKVDKLWLYFKIILKALTLPKRLGFFLQIRDVWFAFSKSTSAPYCPQKAYVQSDYWIRYHQEFLGWHKTDYEIKPIFEKKMILDNSKSFDCQYVAQTLVEDGRYDRETFKKFFKDFVTQRQGAKIVVILHPRSDISLYDNTGNQISFEKKYCYRVPTFGHYSSLLFYLKAADIAVTCLDLENHPVPNDVKQILSGEIINQMPTYTQYINECKIRL